MADKVISKIKLGSAVYRLKDEETQAAVTALQTAVASSLIFKGVISSATGITGLTDYRIGWTYKANATFTVAGLGILEPGDMAICVSSFNGQYKPSDWTVVQNNVDTMTGASSTATGTRGLVPAPQAGDNTKYLKGDGTWGSPVADVAWGSFSDLI